MAADLPDWGDEGLPRPGHTAGSRAVSLPELGAVLFRIGGTTFGGMWAGSHKLETELVHRRGWLTSDEQHALMIASTLIPAPKFLSFGGLIGFRLRGWAGCLVALSALVAPGALIVMLGVILLSPDVLGEAIEPMQRAVGLAILGVMLGNAFHQVKGAKVAGPQRARGIALAASVVAATLAGVPLVVAALTGLGLGALLVRDGAGGSPR